MSVLIVEAASLRRCELVDDAENPLGRQGRRLHLQTLLLERTRERGVD